MAEVALGVAGSVVGIASLAIQLFDSVTKIKAFVDDVKDASQDIAEMLEQLELLSGMIQDIALDEKAHPDVFEDSIQLKRCLRLCNDAVQLMTALEKDLAASVKKRRVRGSLRAIFRASEVEKLAKRLDKAQSSLILAYQIYSNSSRRRDTETIVAEIQKTHVIVQTPPSTVQNTDAWYWASNRSSLPGDRSDICVGTITSNNTFTASILGSNHSNGFGRLRQRQAAAWTTYKVRVPFWVATYVWELNVQRAQSGWNSRFRVYNIIRKDSLIVQACSARDTGAIKRLFMAGEASPLDRTPDGNTLLHWALGPGSGDNRSRQDPNEACRILIDHGVDACTSNDEGLSPASQIWGWHSNSGSRKLALWEMLAPNAEIDFQSLEHSPLVCCTQLPETIMAVRNHMYPPVEGLPLDVRITVASARWQQDSLDCLLARLGCGVTDPGMLRLAFSDTDSGYPLLNALTSTAAHHAVKCQAQMALQSIELIALACKHGADLQRPTCIGQSGQTGTLIHLFLNNYLTAAWGSKQQTTCRLTEEDIRSFSETKLKDAIQIWTTGLDSAGINLSTFALCEKRVSNFCYDFNAIHADPGFSFESFTILDMAHGQKPEDWEPRFSWRLDRENIPEQVVTEFWKMLEQPEYAMVGAWNETWDSSPLQTYETQRVKPSRHWMKKKPRMLENGSWMNEWDIEYSRQGKRAGQTVHCKLCMGKVFDGKRGNFRPCRVCDLPCRKHFRKSPCERCVDWCKIHASRSPCWKCG